MLYSIEPRSQLTKCKFKVFFVFNKTDFNLAVNSLMKIELWTFGKAHKSYVSEGIHLYAKRIQHYCPFEVKILTAGKKTGKMSPDILKVKEAEAGSHLLTPDHTLITLDEKGKKISSAGLSKLLEERQLAADKTLVFLIGGAYGTADSILKKSQKVISLSELTFPHQIVRLIMIEQIYRAFSILHNQPYHHL